MTWLRCVDTGTDGAEYALNPAHVITVKRGGEGWWIAHDIRGGRHRVSGDDDSKVEALIGAQQDSKTPIGN